MENAGAAPAGHPSACARAVSLVSRPTFVRRAIFEEMGFDGVLSLVGV